MTIHAPPQGKFKGLVNKGTHRFTHFIAAGGEGRVYRLDSQGPGGEPLAGKIYGNKLTRSKIKKLSHMVSLGSPEVRSISAWPVDVLATSRNQVVGFAMPLVSGGTPLHLLRTPKTRLAKMPSLSYPQLVQVAENVAGTVASLNKAGIIVGDINGQNFLVNANGTIQAIDCDSMQVGSNRDWASGVGVEEYIAPELQGRSLKGVIRTPDHDAFALAILLFEVLVLGRHPFGGHANLTIPEAIAKRAHLFSSRKPHPTVFDITGIKPTDIVSHELVHLFSNAFGSKNRPSASDWHDALQRYRHQLQPCSKNGNHAYPSGARQCPWCAMEKKGLPKLFNHKSARSKWTQKTAPATSTKRTFTVSGGLASTAFSCLWATTSLIWWLLNSFLKLLLTPVSTTRAMTLHIIRVAINYVWQVIQSIAQLVVQMATATGRMIVAIAVVVWNGICVLATILFNIALMLGTLYGVLWVLREFFRSLFF